MELMNGRPLSVEGRQAREMHTYDYLDRLGIRYTRVDHAPAMTMEDCAAIDETLGTAMCKNLFLCNRQETDFYLLLIPGAKKFRTKDLSAQLGTARLSFANAENMLRYLDILPGSVSVLGLMNDRENKVRLLIDRDLMSEEYIGCHPCANTSSLRLSVQDLLERILPDLGIAPQIVELPE